MLAKKKSTEQKRAQPRRCFKSVRLRASKLCQKQKPEKKFASQSRRFSQNNQSGSQKIVEQPKDLYKKCILFFQTLSAKSTCEILIGLEQKVKGLRRKFI